jgi:peptidyl-prolyl cis-trans isomerase SurA
MTLALAAAPERKLVDRIVAVVNEDVITLSELDATTKPYLSGQEATPPEKRASLMQAALDSLIAEKLIQQQIREAKLDVSADDVERAIDDIAKQNHLTRDDLKGALESRGMSMAQYKADLEKQLLRLKLVDLKVRSRVVVPDADVRAEWERQVSLEKREKLLKLRHLLFHFGESADAADKKRAMDAAVKARNRVVGGEDFGAVAKAVSEGPTAADGGDLGWFTGTNLLPELARAVAKMQVGEISGPIETDNGVHIVWLEDAKLKEPAGFEAARAQIYQKLYQEEVEHQMKVWVDELRSTGAVEIRL